MILPVHIQAALSAVRGIPGGALARVQLDALEDMISDELRHRDRERDMLALNAAEPPESGPGARAPGPPNRAPAEGRTPEQRLARAQEFWEYDIRDPWGNPAFRDMAREAAFIDDCIRSDEGLGWGTCEFGRGARANISYLEARAKYQWCGSFVSRCFGRAILPEIRRKRFGSTSRLDELGDAWQCKVPVDGLQPGDIVVVGAEGDADGAHVTLLERVERGPLGLPKWLHTYEGNAKGRGPSGETIRGVVRCARHASGDGIDPRVYRFCFGVRPKPEHYTEPPA